MRFFACGWFVVNEWLFLFSKFWYNRKSHLGFAFGEAVYETKEGEKIWVIYHLGKG